MSKPIKIYKLTILYYKKLVILSMMSQRCK